MRMIISTDADAIAGCILDIFPRRVLRVRVEGSRCKTQKQIPVISREESRRGAFASRLTAEGDVSRRGYFRIRRMSGHYGLIAPWRGA
jgi:hypothetical protein